MLSFLWQPCDKVTPNLVQYVQSLWNVRDDIFKYDVINLELLEWMKKRPRNKHITWWPQKRRGGGESQHGTCFLIFGGCLISAVVFLDVPCYSQLHRSYWARQRQCTLHHLECDALKTYGPVDAFAKTAQEWHEIENSPRLTKSSFNSLTNDRSKPKV